MTKIVDIETKREERRLKREVGELEDAAFNSMLLLLTRAQGKMQEMMTEDQLADPDQLSLLITSFVDYGKVYYAFHSDEIGLPDFTRQHNAILDAKPWLHCILWEMREWAVTHRPVACEEAS